MKKTTREFIDCKECNGRGWFLEKAFPVDQVRCSSKCQYCNGEGRILIKETIQESDDMKEFIEKKCGWEWVEPKVCKEKHAHCGEYNPGLYK